MEVDDIPNKKKKFSLEPEEVKKCIYNTKSPVIIKNILSWSVLTWSREDWVNNMGNPKIGVRRGTRQCTKVPQWENNCEAVTVLLGDLLDEINHKKNDTWMYFDYKHMKHYFKNNQDFLESLSWADFGFPNKNGKDSTIWIGTPGAYTSCHMDSYGCNIIAQVYGRKLWVLFPPSKTSVLKPTRVPYEESSIYSDIHFSCGTNVPNELGEARVVEMNPGDVLIVPRHWWHFVENLTTSISINMWIPLEKDNHSRLEEALVRYAVASLIKTLGIEEGSHMLNPNETDLLEQTVDLNQISWCLDQMVKENTIPSPDWVLPADTCLSTVPSMTASQLRDCLLKKCGCDPPQGNDHPLPTALSPQQVINAFCHPEVIAKVADLLLATRKTV